MGTMSLTKETNPNVDTKSLGIIAGEGKLPSLVAQSAKARGFSVVGLALSEDARDLIEPHADKTFLIAPGQLGRNLGLFKKEGCGCAVFIGKVPKLNLLRQLHKLDWTAIRELSKLPNFNDDTIQNHMGDLMEAMGVQVLTQREFLSHLFPEIGSMTERQLSAEEYADIEFGMGVAREIARLDIGQTVVVRNRMVVAIEAIEGTDETIRRAVKLARGPVVVCKVSKPNQDQRFDVPTVGMSTLRSMLKEDAAEGGADGSILVVEAKETLVVDREEMIAFAEKHGIAIVSAPLPEKSK